MDASPFLYSESSPVELKVTQCNSMEYSVCILGVAYSNACACRRLCHDLWVLVPQLCHFHIPSPPSLLPPSFTSYSSLKTPYWYMPRSPFIRVTSTQHWLGVVMCRSEHRPSHHLMLTLMTAALRPGAREEAYALGRKERMELLELCRRCRTAR